MENIMIINEKTPFREGLKTLFEIKFGNIFNIIYTDSNRLSRHQSIPPKLIVVEPGCNAVTEKFLIEMREKGSKVVLLSLEPETVQTNLKLEIFNGFLLKYMPTKEMLTVIKDIIENDNVYVHPDIGYFFLQKLNKKEN
ncbi:hypothetical protein D1B31_18525 [Neobacillus notoginsengisoli]|uniref:DNA-binding response regulator n=1 Tax=Neobacillus notoginsengisoli TaxID=1578198 RepID=A0A417YPZ7_9BACI|nr:hypothetical protein D1B31_18525 [Neobacillus notoginsengisoli]